METVEIIEIWQPVEEGGEMIRVGKGNLKRIAMLVNGHPYFLETDFVMERTHIPKVEAEQRGLLSTKEN